MTASPILGSKMKLSQNRMVQRGANRREIPAPTGRAPLPRHADRGDLRSPLSFLDGNVLLLLPFTELPGSSLPIANVYRSCSN
jgi:hypothetical protein